MPEHILMIEDNESLAAMVGEYLGGFGMAVSTRSTATEGLTLLQQGVPDAFSSPKVI